jgi:hypothetical protein
VFVIQGLAAETGQGKVVSGIISIDPIKICCIELPECLVHLFHCNVHIHMLFYSCVLQGLRHAGQKTSSKISVRPSC